MPYNEFLPCCVCLVTQSCPTLWDPMDFKLLGSSVHEDSPGKNPGVGCHALLQGILPTQGSNSGLPHCRQILKRLSHQRNLNFFYIHILFVLFLCRILTETPSGSLFLERGSFHLPRVILFTEITK